VENRHNEKIGSREVIAIVMLTIGLKATDTTPTLMFKAGYSAGWMLPISTGLVILLPLILTLSLVKKYKDKGLIEIVYKLTGKYIGFIIGSVYFYILFSSLFYNSRSYIDIMSTMFYPKTPPVVLYSALIVSICIMAYLGLGAIGRAAWITFSSIMFVFIALFFLAQKNVDLTFIFPITGAGIPVLLKSSLTTSTIWGDIFYLPVIFPMVSDKKNFKKITLFSFGLTVLFITISMLVYIITFGYPSITYLNYPFQELTRGARFGSYFNKTEAFFLAYWSVAATIRFSAYLYFITAALGHTLKIKNFKPLFFTISALTLALGMLPENHIINIFVVRKQLLECAWAFFMFIPIILWIIDSIRGRKEL
jgi:spore germination protein KB